MSWNIFILILIANINILRVQAQAPELVVQRVSNHWFSLHNDFKNSSDVLSKYTIDLTLEALLEYDEKKNSDFYTTLTEEIFAKRNILPQNTISYKSQPFCSINFSLGTVTGNNN